MSLCSRMAHLGMSDAYCLFTSTNSLSHMLPVKFVLARLQITVAVEAQLN